MKVSAVLCFVAGALAAPAATSPMSQVSSLINQAITQVKAIGTTITPTKESY